MIVPGSTSQSFAAALAAARDEPLAAVEYDRHPDGELLAAVPGFDADRATVVAATTTDSAHLELLQLQDAVREAGATRVTTVLPYMGYARQDAAFEPGQPVSARAVARAVATGTDRVVLVTPHEPSVADWFPVPTTVVEAAPRLAAPLPDDLVEPVFLAPDAGAVGLAGAVRDAYGRGSTDHFEKTRHSDAEVSIEPGETSLAGRDVVIADDIVATGSTTAESVAAVRAREAGRVLVACVHAVLAGAALTRLRRAGAESVHATDTVERPVSSVSAAPAVAPALE